MANEEKRPLKVFLCHASGDKPAVRALYQRLVRDGVDAWLDKEKLLPGQDWRLEIPRAVRESDVVIVCLSNKSITKEGYVQKEIKFALDIANEKPEGTIFLIPARLEDCDVPSQLDSWQWVDLFEAGGYEWLMRSLRLRADKLGLRAGDTTYTDQELEQRLDQLYTEGLAALWVEDWDKAYHRFQAILREKPDYMQAAAKLEEAKRQKYLNELYIQALEAQKSENWPVAVKILEKLIGEVGDYKDASLLLKSAQKKNQLARLYEEAHKLFQAKQWQAVIRVFAQIAAIDPNYKDPDGLLPLAEREAAEVKRLTELNELYSRGVREMDAGKWYEARDLLEQVHKAQIGFFETERLLRKIEREIAKAEELKKRNIQINTLYEQAHGLLRSKNWREALDKVKEVQKLDNQFEDKDEIAAIARAALEQEEQAVQRQNQLAAMYAEAARLLKEEKYQEALDKWEEVKTIDPKYPDRQWVQMTAGRKLAESAKSLQLKPTFVMTRSHWIGVAILTIIAILFASTILWGKSNPIYDNFENPAYNGSYDQTKWKICVSDPGCRAVQENGVLSITHAGTTSGMRNTNLCAQKYQGIKISQPTYYEADLMFPDKQIGLVSISLGINNNAATGCFHHYFYENNVYQTFLHCNYVSQQINWVSKIKDIAPGTWHTVRIEVQPAPGDFIYFLDGQQYDVYHLGSDFSQIKFWFAVSVTAESPSDVIGFIDNVRIGKIEK